MGMGLILKLTLWKIFFWGGGGWVEQTPPGCLRVKQVIDTLIKLFIIIVIIINNKY